MKLSVNEYKKSLVVIIGCDSGVGHSCVTKLLKQGFFVCATVVDEKSREIFQIDSSLKRNLQILQLDLTNKNIDYLKERVYEYIEANGLKLHAIINNAAITHFGYIEWFDGIDVFKKVMEVNCFGYLKIIKLFLPLCRHHQARIINILSGCAHISLPGISPYCISKFAVKGLNESLRREMSEHGVRVISIEPCTSLRRSAMSDEKLLTAQIDTLWNRLDAKTKDAYFDAYNQLVSGCLSVANASEQTNHLYNVVKKVTEAVISGHPKNHYLTGNCLDVLFMAFILPLLPSSLSDLIIRFYSKYISSN